MSVRYKVQVVNWELFFFTFPYLKGLILFLSWLTGAKIFVYDSLSGLPFDIVPESEKNISRAQGSFIIIFFVLIHNLVCKALVW